MMAVEYVLMPRLGMDMVEGAIEKWLKKEGDPVKKGEPILEIASDKATMEVESPNDGFLLKIYGKPGQTIPIEEKICAIGELMDKAVEMPIIKEQTVAAKNNKAKTPAFPSVQLEQIQEETEKFIRISPRARKLAESEGINYSRIIGSGPAGRIVEKDIIGILKNNSTTPVPLLQVENATAVADQVVLKSTGSTYEKQPLSSIRKVIAARMKQSLDVMAQANHRMNVDMTKLLDFRKKLNAIHEQEGVKISILDIFIKVVTKALKKCPSMNCSLIGDEIQLFENVNMGIAVAMDKGLVVPVIHKTDLKDILEITVESKELIEKAKQGKLDISEMIGGTFTITNLGMYEIDSFTAIINPPEAGILGIVKISKTVVVENNEMVIRPMCTLSLTYDHRINDGAPSAVFLKTIKDILQNPLLLI